MNSSEDYDPSVFYVDYEQYPADQRKITINWRLFLAIVNIISTIDNVIAIISILTNILHFIVLTHKTMRNNFINVIMIAICICDLLTLSEAVFFNCHGNEIKEDRYEFSTLPSQGLVILLYSTVDFLSQMINSLIYFIVTIGLVCQLQKIKKLQRNLHRKEEDKTLIVILFAVLYFFYEAFYGINALVYTFLSDISVNVLLWCKALSKTDQRANKKRIDFL
uniref:G_PROTEIN_RECEP_F1_2 domain-containing protein n=1 Tax=Caenorhabditis tropicalis TaxID=1561998 RepID=A0A1I7T6R5_9PELO